MSRGTVLNIQHYCIHDGPGIRTVVFLKGCPLACRWCANPGSQHQAIEPGHHQERCTGCGKCVAACPTGAISLVQGRQVMDRQRCDGCGRCALACPAGALDMLGAVMEADQVVARVRKDAVFYRNSGGGLTLSGGEPLLQIAFATEILARCRQVGINTAVETSGCQPWEVIEIALPHVDLWLYDLKHPSTVEHAKGTGQGNHHILDNLRRLCHGGARVVVRVPCIPGYNDSARDLRAVAAICRELSPGPERVELLPYHKLGVNKYAVLGRKYQLGSLEPPSRAHMEHLVSLLAQELSPRAVSCQALFGTV